MSDISNVVRLGNRRTVLERYDVSPPADGSDVIEWLRWCVWVVWQHDSRLSFASSLIHHCLKYEALTAKQFAAAKDMIDRTVLDFQAGKPA